MTANKKNFYVDNELLYEAMVEYKKGLETDPKYPMPRYLAEGIMKIAHGLSNFYLYAGYTDLWKENMVDDAIFTCISYVKSFNTEKYKNVHAYITKMCSSAFKHRLNIEKKKEATKSRYFIVNQNDAVAEGTENQVDYDFYTDQAQRVDAFEKTRKANNDKQKKRRLEKLNKSVDPVEPKTLEEFF